MTRAVMTMPGSSRRNERLGRARCARVARWADAGSGAATGGVSGAATGVGSVAATSAEAPGGAAEKQAVRRGAARERRGGPDTLERRGRAEARHAARRPDEGERPADDLVLGHGAAAGVAGVRPGVRRRGSVVTHHPEATGRHPD